MKKLLIALIFSILSINSHANRTLLHFDSAIIDSAMEKYFHDAPLRINAMKIYNAAVNTNGGGINAVQLKVVCLSGLPGDLESKETTCNNFIDYMLSKATAPQREVCGRHAGKTDGKEKCVNDFADGGVFEFKWGAKVNKRQAVMLAKEWAKIKNQDPRIVCEPSTVRDCGDDDCLKCRSVDNNIYYEFRFGSIEELNDLQVQKSIVRSVCTMHDTMPDDGTFKIEDWGNVYYAACENTTQQKCNNDIAKSFKKFGYTTKYTPHTKRCEVNFGSISNKNDLNTYNRLDNFVFCDGIQFKQTDTLDSLLEQYVRTNGINVNTFKCDASTKIYTGQGCKANSTNHDEILTCYINGTPFDFVFDDLNEHLQRNHNAGMQIAGCLANGGNYKGGKCWLPNKSSCEALSKANEINCPSCATIKWNSNTNTCEMPSAKLSEDIDLAVKIGTSVVLVSITPAIAMATGGIGTSVAIGILCDIASTAIDIGSEIYVDSVVSDIYAKAVNCNDSKCADELYRDNWIHLQKLLDGGWIEEKDIKNIDDTFVRITSLLSDETITNIKKELENANINVLDKADTLDTLRVISTVMKLYWIKDLTNLDDVAKSLINSKNALINRIDNLNTMYWSVNSANTAVQTVSTPSIMQSASKTVAPLTNIIPRF